MRLCGFVDRHLRKHLLLLCVDRRDFALLHSISRWYFNFGGVAVAFYSQSVQRRLWLYVFTDVAGVVLGVHWQFWFCNQVSSFYLGGLGCWDFYLFKYIVQLLDDE